jgi:hypothetical protein
LQSSFENLEVCLKRHLLRFLFSSFDTLVQSARKQQSLPLSLLQTQQTRNKSPKRTMTLRELPQELSGSVYSRLTSSLTLQLLTNHALGIIGFSRIKGHTEYFLVKQNPINSFSFILTLRGR